MIARIVILGASGDLTSRFLRAFGPEAQPPHNMMTLELAPGRIALSVNVNKPRDLFELEQVAHSACAKNSHAIVPPPT